MERSIGAVLRLLTATAVVIAALGLGFAAASASSEPADPVAEMRRAHEEMHADHGGTGMGAHTGADMDEMHARMSARLSGEDRALHDRMHDACSGPTDERKNT
ncbi:MAG: hypothetical protein KY454_06285 [Actinobacteria bacterium]|nr:hypothetical protein [Actinomycetota bacterium]